MEQPSTKNLKPGLRIIAIVPVRLRSTRLKEKALINIAGKPLIAHTLENAKAMLTNNILNSLYLTTDNEKIANIAKSCGVNSIITPSVLPSGSARIAAALKNIPQTHEAEVVVNIQGDEPCISASAIQELLKIYTHAANHQSKKSTPPQGVKKIVTPASYAANHTEPSWLSKLPALSTLATAATAQEVNTPKCVKVVLTLNGNALYFSRNVIPHSHNSSSKHSEHGILKHIGVYAYKRHFIENIFPNLPAGKLEMQENLEQLRVLENGFAIKVAITTFHNIDINVMEDVHTFYKHLQQENK